MALVYHGNEIRIHSRGTTASCYRCRIFIFSNNAMILALATWGQLPYNIVAYGVCTLFLIVYTCIIFLSSFALLILSIYKIIAFMLFLLCVGCPVLWICIFAFCICSPPRATVERIPLLPRVWPRRTHALSSNQTRATFNRDLI